MTNNVSTKTSPVPPVPAPLTLGRAFNEHNLHGQTTADILYVDPNTFSTLDTTKASTFIMVGYH